MITLQENISGWLIDWLYRSFTAHQHQKGHTVPKQVSELDDDDIIKNVMSPPERYAMVKWMQSPRQKVKSHLEKKSSNEQGNAHYDPRPAKVAG